MENVTKALLIAASVLAAIMIISMVIFVINMNNSADDTSSTLNGMSAKTFNSKYEMYQGICSGSRVKTILTNVIRDNNELFGVSQKGAETIEYCLNVRSNASDILDKFKSNSSMISALNGSRNYGVRYAENITKIQQVIKSSQRYNVWFTYNTKNGLIWEVHIDDV